MPSASKTRTRHTKVCDGPAVLDILRAACDWLDSHAERINALNVFPVPDGDTGTNMSLTMRAALQAVTDPSPHSVGEVARLAARGALLGARGNSGVILSQLLRGFGQHLAKAETLTPADLAAALSEAARVAYLSVSKPVEGTLLTVARDTGEAARAALELRSNITDVLEHCVRAAEAAVARTQGQLQVLREAGVVDAGGEGYRVLLEGAWLYVTGRTIEMAGAVQPGHVLAQARDAEASPFGFCTELVLCDARADALAVRAAIEGLGQSVIVVGDGSLVRIHVHTLRPGQVLEYAVDHGTVQQIKIENMELQHAGFVASHGREQGLSQIGVIAVAAGDGFRELFASLGAAAVIEGGQTMNPSVQEILAAVNSAAFTELVLLPNNPNIILTCNQVRGLTPRRIDVVPTDNVVQGVAAMLAFNYQDDLGANMQRMEEAARSVHTIEITTAVRDAEVDGVTVARGNTLAVLDGRLVAAGHSPFDLIAQALRRCDAARRELVTVYYGQDVADSEARDLIQQLEACMPGPQWECVRGGQPHYPYVISLE